MVCLLFLCGLGERGEGPCAAIGPDNIEGSSAEQDSRTGMTSLSSLCGSHRPLQPHTLTKRAPLIDEVDVADLVGEVDSDVMAAKGT